MANKKNTDVVESVDTKKEKADVKKTVEKKIPRKFEKDELIECRSITYGELLLPGMKSKLLYTWANYGDITYVEYQDLQALKSRNSEYIKGPLFIIENEELLEQWSDLVPIYNKVNALDIDHLFSLPLNQFRKRLVEAPNGFKQSIKNIASAKIIDGTLDSLAKIKVLDEVLETDLKIYINQ